MTKLDKDYIIGGKELDLSLLDEILGLTNDLPVAESEEYVKSTDDPAAKMEEILYLTQKIEEVEKYGGFRKWFIPGTEYGIDKLHKHREFLFAGTKYHERYASWSNQTGKALWVKEQVLTQDGFVDIGSLSVGDYVIGSAGQPVEVLGVFPQGKREIYEVSFSDGSTVKCDLEHLWTVRHKGKGKAGSYKTLTLKQIIEAGIDNFAMPQRPAVEFGYPDLPIDPYLLGLIIGDGGTSQNTVMLSTEDKEIVDYCSAIAPEYGTEFRFRGKCTYQFASTLRSSNSPYKNILKDMIHHLGLGCISHHKRIPEEYLMSSVGDRWALLQGLMDTDGFIGNNGSTCFYSVSRDLCEDVNFLCRSLGLNSSVKPKNGKYKDEHHLSWITYICNTDGARCPFRLSRKVDRWKEAIRSRPVMMKSAVKVFEDDAVCILVDSKDHLFVTNGFILTHNTTSAAYELTLHLTGLYPDWWEGRRFDKPISAYAAGSTNETTRNIIQKELIGEVGSLGTGMIPKELILKTTSKTGVSNAVDMLQVKHVSGGTSVLRFKSYDQGRRAFEGEKIDVVWLDEMPDMEVYSECYTRTITRNGIIFVTATPLDGITPLVLSFYATADILPLGSQVPSTIEMAREDYKKAKEEAEKKGESFVSSGNSKAVIVAGWDDAPWLSEEAKTRILAATPPHLRQARSTGIPGDSGGQVFPIAISEITCDDFPIPAHYRLINAIDPGWNFTGAVFGALDPDTDTLYIYADYKRGQVEPIVHAEAIKTKSKWADAPCIFDYAGMGGRSEEQQIKVVFRKHGLKLINADKSVNMGLAEVWERMSTGRLKIFKSCRNLIQEIATYRRNERGDIIKENDHCLHPDTEVITAWGPEKIKDLVGTEGFLLSVGGNLKKFSNVRMTGQDREIVKVSFEDGGHVLCTPDHKILTTDGWVEAIDSLGYSVYDAVSQSINTGDDSWKTALSTYCPKPSKNSSEKLIGSAENTSNDTERGYIVPCGNISTEKSLKDTTSTTKTTTSETTIQAIWRCSTGQSTFHTTLSTILQKLRLNTLTKWLQSGTGRMKEESGIGTTTSGSRTGSTKRLNENVHSAGKFTQPQRSTGTHFVQTTASPHSDVQVGWTTRLANVLFVGQSSSPINTQQSKRAQENAQTNFSVHRKVVSVEPAGKSDVYCLEVEDTHCLAVNRGYVVHNCVDPLRYLCVKIKMARTPMMGAGGPSNPYGQIKGNVTGRRYF